MPGLHSNTELFLICRSAGHLCALPLDKVREIMRPLPLERMAERGAQGDAPFVLGASVVRGAPVPVLSLAGLLGGRESGQESGHGRYVSLRLGERTAMLAVDSVQGIGPAAKAEGIAPLLGAVEHEAVVTITTHDAELLYVLQASKLVPDSVWVEGAEA